MKTTFIPALSITIFAVLIALNLRAQKADYTQTASKSTSSKISTSFPKEILDADIIKDEKISTKLFNRFNKIFDKASNVKWIKSEKNFLVTFATNETSTHALFAKNGKLIYTIDFCSEKQLPADVKNLITNKYKDCKITSIAKVGGQQENMGCKTCR